MRFIHAADIHLGYQQYGLKERFNDFGRVFLHIVNQAIEQDVDFVLLAGDLFHKRQVEPLAMRVAIEGLGQLRDAGISVLAVEGNHEKAYYKAQDSWMDFLNATEYLKLLNPIFKEGKSYLEPYDQAGGSYVDLPDGIRVYGLKYYGASTRKAVQSFADALKTMEHTEIQYTIVMMHAGLEEQLAHVGRLKQNDVALLGDEVDYVALGHIHKPYSVGDWIYNPGSPETCGMDEAAWPERGYYLVEVTPGENPRHRAVLIAPPRRPFQRLRLEVDALNSPNQVYDAAKTLIQKQNWALEPAPVVELTLSGILPFNRYELDLDHIRWMMEEAWSPLTARVKSKITPSEFQIDVDTESNRPELERSVIRELLERDARFRSRSDAWVSGAIGLKQLVLEKSAPEAILEHLRQLQLELPLEED